MTANVVTTLKIDRKAFSVSSGFESTAEKRYWLVRSPYERLQQMERLRRINYGRRATSRLQRIFTIIER